MATALGLQDIWAWGLGDIGNTTGKPVGIRGQNVPDPCKTRTRAHGYGFCAGYRAGLHGFAPAEQVQRVRAGSTGPSSRRVAAPLPYLACDCRNVNRRGRHSREVFRGALHTQDVFRTRLSVLGPRSSLLLRACLTV